MAYIKDEINKLFSTGFFHIFGSSVLNKTIAFISSVVLVRLLTKQEYGVFTYAWNIYSFVLLLQGMGIVSGVLQIASENSEDTVKVNSVTRFGARFGISFDLILCVVLFAIGLTYPMKIPNARTLIYMLCLLPLVQLLFELVLSYLRSLKKNIEYSRLTLVNTALLFLFSVLGAFIFREKGLVLAYYFAYSITLIIASSKFNIGFFKKTEPLNRLEIKPLLNISFISMINNSLSQLMYLLDIFVLGAVISQETVLASYKVATMIPTAMIFIPQAIVTYIYPYFAEHKDDGNWCLNNYLKVLKGLVLFNGLISTTLFVIAPYLINVLFGNDYSDSIPIFRLLVVNYFISGTFRIVAGNLLVTQRKLNFNLFVGVLSGVINVIADYLFIKQWGVIGAAYATIMVVLVSSVLFVAYLLFTFKNKINNNQI